MIIACLCSLCVLGLIFQPTSATNDPVEIISVNRNVHVTYHKIFHMVDEYTFINTGQDPLSSVILAVPYQFDSNIATFDVIGRDLKKLAFERLPYDGSNLIKWRVYLDTPLFSGDTVWLQNNVTFLGLTSDSSSTIDGRKGHINFNFVKFPTSPYNIRNCTVIFTSDPQVTLHDPDAKEYTTSYTVVSNVYVPRNNITTYSSRYNMSYPIGSQQYTLPAIKFPYIKREIRIDLWGYLYISEEFLIEHNGPEGNFRVTTYSFDIPLDANDVYVFDKFGKLSFSRSAEDPERVSINFDATRYSLQLGENTKYWITYRLPLFNYGYRNGDNVHLNLDILFGDYHGYAENFEVTLIFPKDASINSITPVVDAMNTIDNCLHLFFNETSITDYNSQIVEMEFDTSASYLYVLARPLFFFLVLIAICSVYVITKRILPSEERLFERKTVVPTPILLEFCSLFEEKVSLVSEIEKLDEDLKKRKIKKRIYRNQRKTAERKILEINKDIEDLKIHLKNAGGRFAQIVNELEINEAQRESAKDGLFNLEQRYLRKKISTVAYQKLAKDLETRYKKAKVKIDKLLFELREILS